VLFDEDRGDAVPGLKGVIVPLDPVGGKLACQADNPPDRLKVTINLLVMDEPGQISPRRDSLIKEVLRPLGPETFPELLRRKPDIAAGDTTIAGGCALADQALFQNDDVLACPGERQAC